MKLTGARCLCALVLLLDCSLQALRGILPMLLFSLSKILLSCPSVPAAHHKSNRVKQSEKFSRMLRRRVLVLKLGSRGPGGDQK